VLKSSYELGMISTMITPLTRSSKNFLWVSSAVMIVLPPILCPMRKTSLRSLLAIYSARSSAISWNENSLLWNDMPWFLASTKRDYATFLKQGVDARLMKFLDESNIPCAQISWVLVELDNAGTIVSPNFFYSLEVLNRNEYDNQPRIVCVCKRVWEF